MEPDLEKLRPLLSGLLDGELPPQEAAEVNDALTRSAALREEYEQLCSMDEKLKHLSMIEPADEVAERIWNSPYHRLARDAGVWLIVGGYLALLAYGLYAIATADDGPVLPRIATFAIFGGIAMLLITLIRERVTTHKTDPYKDIKR